MSWTENAETTGAFRLAGAVGLPHRRRRQSWTVERPKDAVARVNPFGRNRVDARRQAETFIGHGGTSSWA